jgi:hypothetical protein
MLSSLNVSLIRLAAFAFGGRFSIIEFYLFTKNTANLYQTLNHISIKTTPINYFNWLLILT